MVERQAAFKQLKDLANLYPGRAPNFYDDSNERGLTICIIDYLTYKGHQAERIHCMFYPIPVGNGLYKKGKSLGDKGTADISATINGISVKIEVKIGSDRLSSFQKAYRSRIVSAGGLYFEARNFPLFLEWYHKTFG